MTPIELRQLWRSGGEVCLLDVREEGPYAEAHPFFAVSLPLSRIELRVFQLVPRRSAPIVVYDNGEGLTCRAVSRLRDLGYQDVSVLDGGLAGYAEVGELFRDVNVPSKAFGELVESICHTPSLSAGELKALLNDKADVAILDVRRFEEYNTMSIPSAVSVPGGEVALRVYDAVPSDDTFVVVNCAGRTRSIIGTQTLVHLGISGVAALRNGTIGWTLAGYELDTERSARFNPTTSEGRRKALVAAARWAERTGVPVINAATLERWSTESCRRTLYRLDVRTPEEYEAGHPEGFASAPGGQLVQATDEWVAVRGAPIVLYDNDGVRARMAASWLVQMGWDVAVMEEGALQITESGRAQVARPEPPDPGSLTITPEELANTSENALVVDLAQSPSYERGHIPGAWFMLRSGFEEDWAICPRESRLCSPLRTDFSRCTHAPR